MNINLWKKVCPANMYGSPHSGDRGSMGSSSLPYLKRTMLMKVMRMEGAHRSVVVGSLSKPPAV